MLLVALLKYAAAAAQVPLPVVVLRADLGLDGEKSKAKGKRRHSGLESSRSDAAHQPSQASSVVRAMLRPAEAKWLKVLSRTATNNGCQRKELVHSSSPTPSKSKNVGHSFASFLQTSAVCDREDNQIICSCQKCNDFRVELVARHYDAAVHVHNM